MNLFIHAGGRRGPYSTRGTTELRARRRKMYDSALKYREPAAGIRVLTMLVNFPLAENIKGGLERLIFHNAFATGPSSSGLKFSIGLAIPFLRAVLQLSNGTPRTVAGFALSRPQGRCK